MEEVRYSELQITYEGEDISKDLDPYVLSLSCQDNGSDQADDLEITLQDRQRLWVSDWFPDKGAEIEASIFAHNFRKVGESLEYPCGKYTIDEIEFSGPPGKVKLRCTSSAVTKSLRKEQKTRSWENTSLRTIAEQIAGMHNIGLIYDAPNVSYNRQDQRKESDLDFLSRIGRFAGVNVKIAEQKLILYAGKSYDLQSPSVAFRPEDLTSWRFKTQAHDIYQACKVDFWDPEKKEQYTYTFTPDNPPRSGQTLQVNKRVESRAAAEEMAKAELRKYNENEVTASLELMGDPRLFAGLTIDLKDFWVFSGKYFLKSVRHDYSKDGGYTCSADTRRTLEY